jgi:hypothetical protein
MNIQKTALWEQRAELYMCRVTGQKSTAPAEVNPSFLFKQSKAGTRDFSLFTLRIWQVMTMFYEYKGRSSHQWSSACIGIAIRRD